MKKLHWLPIRYRCHFKLLMIVYKTLHGMGPAYLRNRLKIKNNTRNTRLTSCFTLYLEVPFNKTKEWQTEVLAIWLPNTGMYYQTILKQPVAYNSSKNY